MRNFLFIALIFVGLNGDAVKNEKICSVKDRVILAVLEAESHPKKGIGYEYLISFNNSDEAAFVKKYLPKYFIDNRTIDCKNLETCALVAKKLLHAGYTNLDMGAFQINSYWHKKDKVEDYFNYEKSYKFACGYLEKMIDKHGYNWYAIAGYNSQTISKNVNYQKKLIDNYFQIQ